MTGSDWRTARRILKAGGCRVSRGGQTLKCPGRHSTNCFVSVCMTVLREMWRFKQTEYLNLITYTDQNCRCMDRKNVCLCLSVCRSVCLVVRSVCRSAGLSVCLSVWLPACLSVCLSGRLVSLSVCRSLFVCLAACLSVCLSVCVRLFVCVGVFVCLIVWMVG